MIDDRVDLKVLEDFQAACMDAMVCARLGLPMDAEDELRKALKLVSGIVPDSGYPE